MTNPIPAHLELYHDAGYFVGDGRKSGYDDYRHCRGVLWDWASMVDAYTAPASILDVGAAYGYLVEWFATDGVDAFGIEPSEFARSQAPDTVKERLIAGALPELPATPRLRYDVVTCTEVMEHVPQELVVASLRALGEKTERLLICLIMLDGPGADGDEGHICLKARQWWEAAFAEALGYAFVPAHTVEDQLNTDPYSQQILWSGRFFAYERIAGTPT